MLRKDGGGAIDEVIAVAKDWRTAITDPQEYAMLEFSEKVAGDAWQMTEADIQKLRSVGFSDVQILEIVCAAAYRVYISKVADALGVTLNEKRNPAVEIVEALTVGRPALASTEG